MPSPLGHDDHVYFVKNGGILSCLALRTGERVYRMRTRGRGTHYASPLIADGKLFTTAGAGQITVLTLRPDQRFSPSTKWKTGFMPLRRSSMGQSTCDALGAVCISVAMNRFVYQRNTQTKTVVQAPLTTPKISPG